MSKHRRSRRARTYAANRRGQPVDPAPVDTRIPLTIDDETRPIWETAKRAAAEVASWPAWKHTEQPAAERDTDDASWHETWREERKP